MTIEHRRLRSVDIRAGEVDGRPGVSLRAIRPDVVDDYGSVWAADAFDESLGERLPVLCWAHDWTEPLGPGVGFATSDDGPTVDFVFSDFDAVPQARRAHAQVADGTIKDCSVGFHVPAGGRRDPTPAEQARWPGVREVIERARLEEVSLVLRGAVPGAQVLAVRTAAGTVPEDTFLEVARQVADGSLTVEEGQAALALAATPVGGSDGDSGETPGELELDREAV